MGSLGEDRRLLGCRVFKRLTEEANRIPDLPDHIRPGIGYRRAVTLTALCEDPGKETSTTPLITVFVDEDGAEIEAGTGRGLFHRSPPVPGLGVTGIH